MPPKSTSSEIEFKLRISKSLMDKVNSYRHDNMLDSKKEAFVKLLEIGLASSIDGDELRNGTAGSSGG